MIKDIKTKEIFEFTQQDANWKTEVLIFLEIDYINKRYSIKNSKIMDKDTFIFKDTKNFEGNFKLLNALEKIITFIEINFKLNNKEWQNERLKQCNYYRPIS